MKNILIILGILLCVNFIIAGICKVFADSSNINLSENIIISQVK